MAHRDLIPMPVVLLVGSAVVSDVVPALGRLSVTTNEWIVTVALAIILFDGGMDIGLRRLKPVIGAVLWLGTAGTLVTAAAMTLAAHAWFDFGWRQALLVGTAIAPTDPAVVFSLLGRREIPGHSRTLLEGESGANDPIGIALIITILSAHGADAGQVASGVLRFGLQMVVGLAVGLLGGWGLLRLLRGMRLPARWFPAVAIAFAVPVFAVATLGRGSGFLAVFVAGIVVGDEHRGAFARLTDPISSAAEVVAFVVLGLSVSLSQLVRHHHLWTGVWLAALLILAVRPVLVGLVLWPVRLRPPERLFVL
ncbi:MAG: potassium/hydrogen antiporter, partial [Pseudonocardiales bacterium]|nr:potassium/hydrogen antiporter [Pseudonocardiales bacterium]